VGSAFVLTAISIGEYIGNLVARNAITSVTQLSTLAKCKQKARVLPVRLPGRNDTSFEEALTL
jgi:hypothetical protein